MVLRPCRYTTILSLAYLCGWLVSSLLLLWLACFVVAFVVRFVFLQIMDPQRRCGERHPEI